MSQDLINKVLFGMIILEFFLLTTLGSLVKKVADILKTQQKVNSFFEKVLKLKLDAKISQLENQTENL